MRCWGREELSNGQADEASEVNFDAKDAASGAVPLRVAGRVSRWWRCAGGIRQNYLAGEERGEERREEMKGERREERREDRRGDVFSSRVMSCVVMSCHVVSCRVASRGIASCSVRSRHLFSCPVWFVFSRPVRSCRVVFVSGRVLSRQSTSSPFMSRLVCLLAPMSFLLVSCPLLS